MTKKMVEVKRMTFAEASEKLSGIAGSRYHIICFEVSRSPNGVFSNGHQHQTSCAVYVDGYSHVRGADWEEAFKGLENLMTKTTPDPMEIAPVGNPSECANTDA